jgi:hypothetical protein
MRRCTPAAVDSPDGVVAIMAPSGSGKSTLALELLRRGWPLFADDVLTLADTDGEVHAHPGTPHMSIAQTLPDAVDPQTLGSTLGVIAGERWLVAHASTARPRPVRMLCLLQRGEGLSLQTHTLDPNPVALTPFMLGLSSDSERQRSRFSLYADLLASATLVRLTAGLEHRPGQLADLLERAQARQPELSPEESDDAALTRAERAGAPQRRRARAPVRRPRRRARRGAAAADRPVTKRWRKDLPLVLDDLEPDARARHD